MKKLRNKLFAYGLGLGVLVLTVLYLPSEKGVVNDPKNEICFSHELVSIPIPESLVSQDYEGDTYSFTREVELNGKKGVIYAEVDENENFYYLGHSASLQKYFDYIPTNLLFSQFDTKEDVLNAGAHADCMNYCRGNYDKGEGRGACKVDCYVDALIALVDAAVPG